MKRCERQIYFFIGLITLSQVYYSCSTEKEKKQKQNFNAKINKTINPKAQVYFAQGNDLLEKGNQKQAILNYNKAISIEPEFEYYYVNRGCAKYELELYEDAKMDFQRAIEINPNLLHSHATYVMLGNCNDKVGDHFGALEAYSTAILKNSEFFEAYYYRSLTKMSLGDFVGAIPDLTESLNRHTFEMEHMFKKSSILFNRGVAKNNSGDRKGACKDWEEAKNLGDIKAKKIYDALCSNG